MLVEEPDAWRATEHAGMRYAERLAPVAEPIDLAHEPGYTTSRFRLEQMLGSALLALDFPARTEVRAQYSPPHGPILVLDRRTRTIITCYPPEKPDDPRETARLQELIARRLAAQRRVERRLREYRYVYAAPGKRWPAWLGG